jgi:hypothetical protein
MFPFQLAVYCGTQAGGLSGKYLDTGKCKGLSNLGYYIIHNKEQFVSPSGTSELGCATTKTDTAERSISMPVR